jgi:hypothetical protein
MRVLLSRLSRMSSVMYLNDANFMTGGFAKKEIEIKIFRNQQILQKVEDYQKKYNISEVFRTLDNEYQDVTAIKSICQLDGIDKLTNLRSLDIPFFFYQCKDDKKVKEFYDLVSANRLRSVSFEMKFVRTEYEPFFQKLKMLTNLKRLSLSVALSPK